MMIAAPLRRSLWLHVRSSPNQLPHGDKWSGSVSDMRELFRTLQQLKYSHINIASSQSHCATFSTESPFSSIKSQNESSTPMDSSVTSADPSSSSDTSSNANTSSSTSGSEEKKQSSATRSTPLGFAYDVVLGIVTGYALYQLYDFLFYFPDPFPLIFTIANEDPIVQEMVGSPIRMNHLRGTWTGSATDEVIDVKIPIRGPKGTGTLYSRALNLRGEWKFLYLQASDSNIPQRHSVNIPAKHLLYNESDTENNAGTFFV
jgi:hypothetical protein